MDKEQIIKKVAIPLLEYIEGLNYGKVSATLTVHEGRVVNVCHEINQIIRKRKEVQDDCSK